MNVQPASTMGLARGMLSAPFTWRTLLRVAAVGNVIVLVVMGVVLRDRLPLGLAVAILIGMEFLHVRGGLPGDVLLGLIFFDTSLWTLGAALSNVVQGEELFRLVVPASLAAFSTAGFVSAGGILLRRRNPEAGGWAARFVGLAAVAFFVLVVAVGFVAGRGQALIERPTDLVLRTENMTFSPTELTADGGQVTVVVDNHDVWWHTFTIEALQVDLKVPSSGKRQITFTAEAGTYAFYCAIPGHDALGMRGTLTVR